MKKIAVTIIVLVCLQGIHSISADSFNTNHQKETIIFSDPITVSTDDSITLRLDKTKQYASSPGEAFRPMMVKTYTYPFGTCIEDISVSFLSPQDIELSRPLAVKSSPHTIYHGRHVESINEEPNQFLEASFYHVIDSGIQNSQRVLFLTLYIIPLTYNQETGKGILYNEVEINIRVDSSKQPVILPDEYDMVIIAPESFSSRIQPLIEHKNSLGIETFMASCESIYDSYSGRDDAENIKLFIKNAIESYGVEYVLLIGGRKGGIFEEKWYVPVRYSHASDGWEDSFISDLYYADIYNETGSFATWDPNGNGVIAEFKGFRKDTLGLIPDVYLGRLPCTNARDVTIMVNKIIEYESSNKESWFYDMVVVGGDSAHVSGDLYFEGEEENKKALEYMSNFTAIHCWTSDNTFTEKADVMNAISQGCGFLFFDGHASPARWSTHPPQDETVWIEGPDVFDMPDLQNGNKFPVCVVGGCHISQFNVSLFNIPRDILRYGIKGYFLESPFKFYYMEWVPKCWSWQLASMNQGGSIATMGYTGFDWFAIGDDDKDGIPDCTQYFSGFMNTHFFKNYGVNNLHILGQAHTQTIIDYIHTHPPMNFNLDCKTVQEFVLFGDPSLQLEASI